MTKVITMTKEQAEKIALFHLEELMNVVDAIYDPTDNVDLVGLTVAYVRNRGGKALSSPDFPTPTIKIKRGGEKK